MEFTGGGTAILIALAAGLWLVYLVPMWRRRSEYLSTERNAVRLQQTLRIMAQTAELPEAVRAEMTAREIANQERTLAARQREEQAIARAREAAAQRAVRERLAQTAPGLAAEVDAAQRGQARLRRSRAATSLLTLAALVGLVASALAAAWAWTALAGFVAVSGIVLLSGLARANRRRSGASAGARRAPRFVDFAAESDAGAHAADEQRAWTPVPLPKPRYLAAPHSALAAPRAELGSIDHAAVLAAAAAEAERAQRAATMPNAPAEAPAASAPDPAAPVASPAADATGRSSRPTALEAPAEPPSRFARMGLLEGLPTEAPDLDDVLQRRRAVG